MNTQTIADMEIAGKRVLIRRGFEWAVDCRERSQHAEVRELGEWSR